MLRQLGVVVVTLGGVLGVAEGQVAPAKEPAPGGPSPIAQGKPLSHKGQLQVALRTSLGLRAIVAYDSTDYCGDSDATAKNGNAPVCTSRAPFSIDLEAAYGLTDRVDLIVETRVGIESDFGSTSQMTDGPRMFHLAPGARVFFSDAGATKLFTTGQLVLDFAGYEDTSGKGRGFDFGVRNLNGLWWDLDRAYGFMVYAGETLTFGRWLRAELEVGVGVSGRFF